jgi:hypothetical protein
MDVDSPAMGNTPFCLELKSIKSKKILKAKA